MKKGLGMELLILKLKHNVNPVGEGTRNVIEIYVAISLSSLELKVRDNIREFF